MKQLLIFVAIAPLLLTFCSEDDGDCVVVSGPITNETRSVDDFHSISLQGVGNILLTQGTPQSLKIETNQSVHDLLKTQVSNGELRIELDDCINGTIDKLDIHITIPDIQRLEISGVGNILGQNEFDLFELELEIEGVGEVSIMGITNRLEITTSGVGNVHAFGLTSNICEVNLIGTGNVEVTVELELEANISGAGNILYKGFPTIDANISGSGTLINAN